MNTPRRRPRIAGLVIVLVVGLAATFATSLREGENALIDRRYADAVTALQKALGEEPVERQPRVLLLLARAQELAGQDEAAVQTYGRILAEHAESAAFDRAAFEQAETLIELRRFREAADVYRGQVERLTGAPRKEEIAATYLGLADRALSGQKPDPKRAAEFYDLAVDLGLVGERARNVRLLAIEAYLRAQQPKIALPRLPGLIRELAGRPEELRARLLLARCHAAIGEHTRVREVCRDLIARAPASVEAAEAAWRIAESFGVPEPGASRLDLAIAALRDLAERYPSHEQSPKVDFLIARCQLSASRSEDALASLRRFLESRGDSGLPELANARALVGDVLAKQGQLEEAIVAWRAFLSAHTAHTEWERVQRAIVTARFDLAGSAEQAGETSRARELYEAFLAEYPLDDRNAAAARRIAETYVAEEKIDEAIAAFERCAQNYRERPEQAMAWFRLGEIFETTKFDYVRAIEAYRASGLPAAVTRLERLIAKSFTLRTQRAWRVGEAASIELTSRNIPSVRMRVHRIDLETWFRATHRADSVERLDIEVIAADRTTTEAVPDYQPFRESVRQIPIGFSEPGAYVVKVDDSEREATTLVLVTDLGLTVRSSRQELLAFVQNLREDKVAPGVRVVVSDGTRPLAEGLTDPDGIYRLRDGRLAAVSELVVYAVDASGSGAGNVQLDGLSVGESVLEKSFAMTDRPAYVAGQTVHSAVVARDWQDGRYVLPKAEHVDRLRIASPNGRVVYDEAARYSDFGTVEFDYELPEDADLGRWTLSLDRGAGRGTTTTFEVARFELPKLQLTIVPDRNLVFRGEPIAGHVELRHFYGEPARGRAITIRMHDPDGSEVVVQGTSNAEGRVAFQFASDELTEEALIQIDAEVAEDGIRAQRVVPVVLSEFVPSVKVARDVQLAGQSFQAEVVIADRAGEPLAKAGELVVLRIESGRRGRAEVEVSRHAFRTASEDGRALVRVVAERGGAHVLRVISKDRFGQDLTAERVVTISGNDDANKLRILLDRAEWRVGETAKAKVVHRGSERLGLQVTIADGFLDAKPIRIRSGESEIAIPLEELHAPNFALALSAVDDATLLTAEAEFTVDRGLAIEIKPDRSEAEPDSEVGFAVTVRDARGRPVVGRLAVALIPEALGALFADRTMDIQNVFWGLRRGTATVTASSCGWEYRATTKAVSRELIAEERRREQEREEAARRELAARLDAGNVSRGPTSGGRVDPSGRPIAAGPGTAGQVRGRFTRQSLDGVAVEPEEQSEQVELIEELARDAIQQSAFDSNQWNSAIGLGGGAGGRYGSRRGGRALNSKGVKEGLDDGVWLPNIVTDAEGHARFTIRMPDRSSGWKFSAHGVTKATDVGRVELTLRTARDLVVSLDAPPFLVEGDRSTVRARLHRRVGEDAPLRVNTTVGETADERTVSLGKGAEESFDLPLATGSTPEVLWSIAALDVGGIHAEGSIPVLPYGVELRAGKAGMVRDRIAFDLEVAGGRGLGDLRLELDLGRGDTGGLAAVALAPASVARGCVAVAPTYAAIAQRLMAALAVEKLLTGNAHREEREVLRSQIDGLVRQLASAALPDGSFGWITRRSGSDAESTAHVVLALQRARAAGFANPTAAAGARWLIDAVRGRPEGERALLERALVASGHDRFENLNALHRRRASLDPDSLSHLALAWRESKRPELAAEIEQEASTRIKRTSEHAVAFARLAQSRLLGDPGDPQAREWLSWLESMRDGIVWSTSALTAAAVEALASLPGSQPGSAMTRIEVAVNGVAVPPVVLTAQSGAERIHLASEGLRAGKNRIELQVVAGGEVRFGATLRGFSREFAVGTESGKPRVGMVRRFVRPDFLRDKGKPITPGFSVVRGNVEYHDNLLTQLEVGVAARVETTHWMIEAPQQPSTAPAVVVEEPIPAGVSVDPASIEGSFEQHRLLPDRIVAWFRPGSGSGTIRYRVVGRFPGEYRVLPTIIAGVLRPDLVVHGEPGALKVLPRGAKSSDVYRLTPDELWALGKSAFESRDFPLARERLGTLASGWMLAPEVRKELARMMLILAIETRDAAGVVRWFEELKDIYPELVLEFDSMRAVGQSYMDLGEFESAVLVYRGVTEASFLREAAVATTLERLGEVASAAQFLETLIAGYPALSTMRQSFYGLAQKLGVVAAGVQPGARVDPRVGARGELFDRSIALLREFLIQYPDDPLAEEACFSWATTLVEAGRVSAALEIANAAVLRYGKSAFEDEFLYTAGYARFLLGQPDDALALVRRVASEKFTTLDGATASSQNHRHAIYLEGQIHHALGRAKEALSSYDQVVADFQDAAEASDYFRAKSLSLPEVTRIGVGADAVVELEWRNLREAALKVYKVDLLRLYLIHKSLDNVRDILLHGIRPLHEATVALGDGTDYVGARRSKVALPLSDAGAYLVVVRSEDRIVSGLVLRSDLEVEAQESVDIGRVRVNVKRKGGFVAGAQVRVVGSGDGTIKSGATDPRGIFIADGLVGRAAVIVEHEGSFAFFRGSSIHQPEQFRPAPPPPASKPKGSNVDRKGRQFDGWEFNLQQNGANRARQVQWLEQNVLNQQQRGVEVRRAK
ncbi:MAG: tetratricopeptide repeat protein [Planctomycetota bacterium]